jgi:hypothetical protein
LPAKSLREIGLSRPTRRRSYHAEELSKALAAKPLRLDFPSAWLIEREISTAEIERITVAKNNPPRIAPMQPKNCSGDADSAALLVVGVYVPPAPTVRNRLPRPRQAARDDAPVVLRIDKSKLVPTAELHPEAGCAVIISECPWLAWARKDAANFSDNGP